jgi:hypothetical protein
MSTTRKYTKSKQCKTELLQIRVTPEQKAFITKQSKSIAEEFRTFLDTKRNIITY